MTATTRSYPSTTCWKVGSWGLQTYHQLCILIQVLVRFTRSYRREYRPVQNPYPQTSNPLFLLHPLSTPTTSFQTPYGDPLPFRKPLRTYQLPLRTVTRPYENPYPPANRYGHQPPLRTLQDLFHPLRTILHYTVWQTQASKSAKAKRSGALQIRPLQACRHLSWPHQRLTVLHCNIQGLKPTRQHLSLCCGYLISAN